MVGIVLTLFYNLPFELLNFKVSDVLLMIACVLSIISAYQYYGMAKPYLFPKPEKSSRKKEVEKKVLENDDIIVDKSIKDEIIERLKKIEQDDKIEL